MGFAKALPILRAGGKLAKQRPVLPPSLRWILVEPVTDEGEQLGRLVDHVMDEVHSGCDRQQDRHAARDLNCARRLRERLRCPANGEGEGGGGWFLPACVLRGRVWAEQRISADGFLANQAC
jgi:hypothetical protein